MGEDTKHRLWSKEEKRDRADLKREENTQYVESQSYQQKCSHSGSYHLIEVMIS
jgi:hypothetical protein